MQCAHALSKARGPNTKTECQETANLTGSSRESFEIWSTDAVVPGTEHQLHFAGFHFAVDHPGSFARDGPIDPQFVRRGGAQLHCGPRVCRNGDVILSLLRAA